MDEAAWPLSTIGKALMLPPGGPLLVAAEGLALRLCRWQRVGIALLCVGLVGLACLLATLNVAVRLVRTTTPSDRSIRKPHGLHRPW